MTWGRACMEDASERKSPEKGCILRQCDAQAPSCSVCLEAGVPCVALDAATNAIAPRSIARYLEARIAALESQAGRGTISTRPASDLQLDGDPSNLRHVNGCSTSLTNPAISLALHDITTSFLGLTQTIRLAGCAAAPTQIPSAKKPLSLTDLDENHPRSILNQPPSHLSLTSVPTAVAEFLFDIYINRIINQYPFYHSADVVRAFNAIFHHDTAKEAPGSPTEARDVYVVSLIMAISLSTAARSKQARAQSLATGLFRTAMLHVSEVLSNDLAGLQALLLLMQYTFLNPSVANLWLLTGLSSEACIDLGLHQELPATAGLDLLERDMRRRIFWCAWEMEVAVCAGFHRPLRTQNKHINVSFPVEFGDYAISRTHIDTTAPRTKFVPRRIWLYRKIESDIMSVLYQNEPLPDDCPSLAAWMTRTEAAMRDWTEEVHRAAALNQDASVKSQWDEMELYADIAYNYILVLLFRPSPRIKMPSREDLMKGFTAAVQVATGYWEQANTEFGYIKYVFHPCHHTFSSAVVFLQALQYCKVEIAEQYSLEEVEGYMMCFSRFFSTISERWPAATRCLQEYERLLGPIKKEYSEFLLQRASLFNQQSPMRAYPVGDYLGDAIGLDESFAFWEVSNPFIDFAGNDSIDTYAYPPYDWNAEFGFGMDPTLAG
ncbi:hypothetical protein A1O3_01356 [Capronia epimyces CBS 606.96]|uniref:Xylanolytic transcriptional activator regulatory domain-containing protein n=1 Tax=Capronia epimyces CBS 606.96 TaxID=1182542 RepID=W9YIT7_9EURO|nr:uncharacterized protein A1O3_01356 [Capronia epimyces CBS 606.96]EXJ92802.1 hypothetical protein A1O3_01356 [Capronia epimyces CBS 606.96]